jgi:cyclase
MATVAIVDYGAGNLSSVARGLEAAGATPRVAANPREAEHADALVIPGVGHFAATAALGDDWRTVIFNHVRRGRPLLGICLGMQWLFEGSDEAPDVPGAGLLRGRAFRLTGGVKVPHAGWNLVEQMRASALLNGCKDSWAYFTHTYACDANVDDAAAVTTHGSRFAAVVDRGRVFGTQYHPEKSGAAGQQQLANFVAIAAGRPIGVAHQASSRTTSERGLGKRLIACLDVRDGEVVKGIQFGSLRAAGDPAMCARQYNGAGVDEVVVLDITATTDGRSTLTATVRAVARELSVPLAVGGGIRSERDACEVLDAGADKVCLNTAALREPALVTRLARVYGSQAVVVAVDAKRTDSGSRVFSRAGSHAEDLDATAWAIEAERLGAGEILLTSIDRDGTRAGFDCELTADVSAAVAIPVIASGGAGRAEHFAEVFTTGRADAALAASVFHFGEETIAGLKQFLLDRGIRVRPC